MDKIAASKMKANQLFVLIKWLNVKAAEITRRTGSINLLNVFTKK
jgi:hypothetical protein